MSKNLIFYFLLIYLVIWIIWWFHLDEIDKLVLEDIIYYLLFKDGFNSFQKRESFRMNNVDNTFIFECILLFFTIPFRNKDFITEKLEGGMYVQAQVLKDPELAGKMNDKLWWYTIFKKNNISTPKIYYYSKNNKIEKMNNLPENMDVIVKPIDGVLGIMVNKMNSEDALNYIKENDNMIIQEMIKDYSGKVRHFRIITTSSGEIFSIFSLSTNKGIASNHDAGGIIEICNDGNCLEEKNRLVLNNMAEQLKHFHKETELSKYYSIGWDVMIKNENGFSIPYCLEGNAPHSSWFYPDHMPKDLINRYRQGFIKQYKGF
jgi:hypothetical protein